MATRAMKTPRAWQRMLSGRRLDLIDPSPVDVEMEDIAHGLARVARWNGQTRGEHAFSVAQHSLLVLEFCRRLAPDAGPDRLLMALLHDAPEYVVGDMISPFKAVIGGDYKSVEERLLAAIQLRFGLPPQPPAAWKRLIKKADSISAYHEAVSLAGFSAPEARGFFGDPGAFAPPEELITPMAPRDAQRGFVDAFNCLEQARRADPRPHRAKAG